MKSDTIFIGPDGNLTVVGDPALDIDGIVNRKRASTILPCGRIKLPLFRLLRRIFGDRGRVAAWTRTWRGIWTAKIHSTGKCEVSASRAALVLWEQKEIERELINQ